MAWPIRRLSPSPEMDSALLDTVRDAPNEHPHGVVKCTYTWVEDGGIWFVEVRPPQDLGLARLDEHRSRGNTDLLTTLEEVAFEDQRGSAPIVGHDKFVRGVPDALFQGEVG